MWKNSSVRLPRSLRASALMSPACSSAASTSVAAICTVRACCTVACCTTAEHVGLTAGDLTALVRWRLLLDITRRRARLAFGDSLLLWLADARMLRCRRSAKINCSAGCSDASEAMLS